jgi:hypothetical protein
MTKANVARLSDRPEGRAIFRPILVVLGLMLVLSACGRLTQNEQAAADGGSGDSVAGDSTGGGAPGSTGDPDATTDPNPSDGECEDPKDPPTDADPDSPVSNTICDDDATPPDEPQPEPASPRPGMADVRAIPWDQVTVGPDDRSLTIRFWSGVEPCYVLDHIDVVYRADRVIVALFEGHDPQDEDTACIEIALLKSVVIALDQPVDGRQIVDGADRD